MMPVMLAVRAPSFLPQSIAGALFESHLILWAAAIVLGGVLLFLARSRVDPRMQRAGQAVLVITLAWILAARFVETASERLYSAHTGLASAVERADLERVFTYFESDFTVPEIGLRGDMLPAAAREQLSNLLKQYGIKESYITSFTCTLNSDGTAVSRFTALTSTAERPLKTTWQLSWNDESNSDWKIQNATLLKLGDTDVRPGDLIR